MWLSDGRGYLVEKAPAESPENFFFVGVGRQWMRSALINLMSDFS
jgi:hypothetical protein